MNEISKYRISFSAAELISLETILKEHAANTAMYKRCRVQLLKISEGLVQPDYTAATKLSVEQKLGLVSSPMNVLPHTITRKLLLDRYNKGESLTEAQILSAIEEKSAQKLELTEEERRIFNAEQARIFNGM